ncbi:glucose-1-phosphate cytidylyltransferase [Methylobacter sp. BlB1]|uniref:glucose-1-phosphate cytidylyltransferase n=1 Tax=Methylobacter sp. BlB1 TaxID=2785914 RepID=UPI001892ECF9|nr:glucose-1-phosphate cytidylyltransferase [Methylobacter sp. BlB1]MBF6650307.1 glucose-1-phosphate cytidylyltransferase [Methylobacter sp. BlB1]
MKVIIFAGGLGSRISEESILKPKPMIDIGGKPILWHIMKIYQSYGHDEFIICLGYKGYLIKEYFINYFYHNSDITVDLKTNQVTIHKRNGDGFKVTLVDTGVDTMTAGRLKLVQPYLDGEKQFMLTYGDAVSDIDINSLIKFHNSHGKTCTVTAVQPVGKFGVLKANPEGNVSSFVEKPNGEGAWINAGFFVLNNSIFDYLDGVENISTIMWEEIPMRNLVSSDQMMMYRHTGFWKCMDILRDKKELEDMWSKREAKWKIW